MEDIIGAGQSSSSEDLDEAEEQDELDDETGPLVDVEFIDSFIKMWPRESFWKGLSAATAEGDL